MLADLASAHDDDGDRAADYLNQALDALQADWYGTGFDRVRAVRPVLADSHHGARSTSTSRLSRAAVHAVRSGPRSLCLRTSSGSSASESRRNRHRR